jgi:hypothetical protein
VPVVAALAGALAIGANVLGSKQMVVRRRHASRVSRRRLAGPAAEPAHGTVPALLETGYGATGAVIPRVLAVRLG